METTAMVNVGVLPDLAVKGRALLKIEGKQIAIFKSSDDQVFAINNRCPHEGYPLIEGTITEVASNSHEGLGEAQAYDEIESGSKSTNKDRLKSKAETTYKTQQACKLACNWHGWSFDLASGKALKGRDPVRTYPIERRGEEYYIDLTDIEPADRIKRAYMEFDEAIGEHDYERMARALCRLEQAGEPLENSVNRAVIWSVDRFERGIGHAHAGLADWLRLSREYPDKKLLSYLEAAAHFSWDGVMGAHYPLSDGEVAWNARAFVDAIEAVDEDAAIRLARGGLRSGLVFKDFKPLFQAVIFNHYMGFGHPAIYLMKVEELIDTLGAEIEETLIFQMTRYLTSAAREDLIPEFRDFAEYLNRPEGAELVDMDELPSSGDNVRTALLRTASYRGSLQVLWEHLLRESAVNMLRFDLDLQNMVEQPIARNIGWLDFTHAITFGEAVKFHGDQETQLMKSGLLQMACFVGRNARFLKENEFDRYRIKDHDGFIKAQKQALFDMDVGEYIYSVHRLKMICAIENLLKLVTDDTADILIAALHKYLTSRTRMRHPARALYQARETVLREG